MRIIARRHLVRFWTRHAETHSALLQWEMILKRGVWHNLSDLQASFPKAKSLGGGRMRFEIKGGNYRLIAAFDFDRQLAFIKFIGTHADYDVIDALTVSHF